MIIIYSHPNHEGHNGYILQKTKEYLDLQKIKYEVLDLYQMDFDPRLKPEEHYSSGHEMISKDIKKIQIRIKKENKFVFVYPNWWNSPPAILKGFCDRVFTDNFAFVYKNKRPVGILKGKATAFTTSGGPEIFERFIALNKSISLMTKDVLRFVGIRARGYRVDNCWELNDRQKRKIEKMVNKGMKWLMK